ncbi:non-canonical purine NTP pyrophosphatase [Candidatus Woesebacteria bacterium]|nr:non-canonical purine NTP pyrophosphatase [Candidatus Woesebacteria bacterium]MCD8546619.1 non-canonical purine NTP pyrophosphatase [Candidatus Woesebacteria bacterium]
MITFVTGNAGKYAEAKKHIPELHQLDIDLEEIQSLKPEDVVKHKLLQAAQHCEGMIVVDDTSLSFDALGGLPGPFIKWFLKSLGTERVAHLAAENPRATATCTLGLFQENGEIKYFTVSVPGTIVAPRGESGFGWDPIFVPEGSEKTFAEMTEAEKDRYKMRPKAFRQLQAYLE